MRNVVFGKHGKSESFLARYGFSIGLYAAIGGVAYLSLAGPQDAEMPAASHAPVPASMTVGQIASLDMPVPTTLAQAAPVPPVVNAIPLSRQQELPALAPVPIPRPAPSRDAVATRMPADVQRYDHCTPACETGDPMLAASMPPLPEAPPMTEVALDTGGDDVGGFAPLRSARMILHRTAAVPGSLLRGGRSAVERVVADW